MGGVTGAIRPPARLAVQERRRTLPGSLAVSIAGPALAMAVTGSILAPASLAAQSRTVEQHEWSSPEGRLMGFYSDALAFSAVGAPRARRAGAIELGLELSYVPPLSKAQRTAGNDKPEATNLAPVLPRPRALLALPGSFAVEGSWIPPLPVFGVTANLLSIAVTRPIARIRGVDLVPRLSALTGEVRGPITCNADITSDGSLDLEVYYADVCHGQDSDDHFEPRHLSGELVATTTLYGGALAPYASVGARHERTRFDIGVLFPDGSRDTDHPVLESEVTRAFLTGGVTWLAGRWAVASSELYYAPGSLFTVRLLAGVRLR
jgi:hypothetical protein